MFVLFKTQNLQNEQCLLKYNSNGFSTGVTDKNTRLKLQQFYFAFLVLFFGLLISFVQLMREKMHFYFEQQQNKISEMENARVAAVKVEAVVEQADNKLEQEKVSFVTEKKKVADTKVNKNFKAVSKKTNIRNQGKRAV